MTLLAAVYEDEISGVPVFWVDTDRPTLSACLVFRTGIVDESLPTSGWTHLVEHLALNGRGRGALQVNGSTSLLRTTFDAHGPAEAVAGFLGEVSGWLAGPRLDMVASEREVLRAEAAQRPRGPFTEALLQRYGAGGPGVAAFDEVGLGRATAERLEGFVRSRFTAGNGVLVLDGAPSADLRLRLGNGERQPFPDVPETTEALPGAYVMDSHVCSSGVVGRGAAAQLLADLLGEDLRRELREREHSAYSPWWLQEPVSGELTVVAAGSAISPSVLPRVVDHVYGSIENLRRNGPDPRALASSVEALVQTVRDPYAAVGLAHRAALRRLEGLAPLDAEAYLEQIVAVTPADIADAAEQYSESLLMGIPVGAAWKEDLPVSRWPVSSRRPDGRSYRSLNAPADRSRLVVSDEVVAVGARDEWRVIPFTDVAAVLTVPDGGREFVDRSGWRLLVEPSLWRDGRAAAAALDRAVGPEVTVPVTRGVPGAPVPAGLVERWSAVPYLLTILVGLAAVGVSFLAVSSENIVAVSFTAIGALAAVVLVVTRGRT